MQCFHGVVTAMKKTKAGFKRPGNNEGWTRALLDRRLSEEGPFQQRHKVRE